MIKDESTQIIRQLGTSQNWLERKSYLLPLKLQSVTDLQNQNNSVGMIKPRSIMGHFFLPKQNPSRIALTELSGELEEIPYQFGYRFVDGEGVSYQCPIINWEMAGLYKSYRDNSRKSSLQEREQDAIAKIIQKLDEFLNEKDLYFILSSLEEPMDTFSIVGIFHPPLVHFEQMSLF